MPPRAFGVDAPPVRYPDPDIVQLDPRFARYKLGNAAIQRLATGCLWAEGPAWSAVGRYLIWSDAPNDRQLRWLDDNGRVSVVRRPTAKSNGNTFDFAGRLVACEHATRRVVRYEHDSSVTVLAERWQGKHLNAPNDLVVHPDGGVWFTDPGYGALGDYEGRRAELELKEAVYRVDPGGQLDLVIDDIYKPNGLCFSPDYIKLYVSETGSSHYAEAPRTIRVYDVRDRRHVAGGREFAAMALDGRAGIADGLCCDVDGNVWAAGGWVTDGDGAGYDGVHVFAPDGARIGLIQLPEVCSNVCFGGEHRNRLFMTASQSLYAVYLTARDAHIC